MKLLALLTLVITGTTVAACGGTRSDRNYDHDVVYRTPSYEDRYYVDDDDDERVVYTRPTYRAVPVDRDDLIYGDGGYYYYYDRDYDHD
ncbi:hypothetical protein [Dongia deserti]|uniref:hypothetical protein n=1 Tax=Dongia deserti TaxID=2268030 RepID=UPI000E65D37A|nr:hypothetical protein [Dongia deserti]